MTSEARAILAALCQGLWVSHIAYSPRSWRLCYRYQRRFGRATPLPH